MLGTPWRRLKEPPEVHRQADREAPRVAVNPSASRPWIIVAGQVLTTGGQDRANLALAARLAEHGREVHLVSHDVDRALGAAPSITVHRAWRPMHSDLLGEPSLHLDATRLARALGARDPVVVVNGGNCRWPDINWVHYVHAGHPRSDSGSIIRRVRMQLSHQHWLRNERQALRSARFVVANSHRTRQDLVEHVGVPESRIQVIYYGIDAEQFRPPGTGERNATRRALGWDAGRPVVLFVGALGDRRKGFDTVYDAWRALHRRRSTLDPLLVVIGRGAMLSHWQQQVQNAGLSSSIQFLGFRDDVPRLMRAADALVSPTRYEAYGLGVQEALACGLPGIVTASAGVAERYPLSLQQLLLSDPDDGVGLAACVERALEGRDRMATDMAAFGAQLRSRSWNCMAQEFIDAAAARS